MLRQLRRIEIMSVKGCYYLQGCKHQRVSNTALGSFCFFVTPHPQKKTSGNRKGQLFVKLKLAMNTQFKLLQVIMVLPSQMQYTVLWNSKTVCISILIFFFVFVISITSLFCAFSSSLVPLTLLNLVKIARCSLADLGEKETRAGHL